MCPRAPPSRESKLVETRFERWELPEDRVEGSLVSARGIELHGPWGHVFGPLDIDIEAGGVTVLAAQSGAARTALLMALCGRMRLSSGSLTVLGYEKPSRILAVSAIACLNELDEVRPSVTVRDMVTEQLRWNSPWYKFVPRVSEDQVADMCAYTFGGVDLPRSMPSSTISRRSNNCCCGSPSRTPKDHRYWWWVESTRSPTTTSGQCCYADWSHWESTSR